MSARDLWLRLRSLLFGRRVERELQDELDFHLEMQARKNRARGVADDEARLQARRKFGNVGSIAEECREQRGVQFVESLARDIRFGSHQLRRTPLFTAVAVLSLALGIGANTALFTVFDTLYLRKLPVPQPDDLVSLRWRALGDDSNPLVPKAVFGNRITTSDGGNSAIEYTSSTSFPLKTFDTFRKSVNVPAEVFGFASFQASADIRGWPHDVTAQLVSGNYFPVLGVTTVAGRPLELHDDDPSAEPAAVMSYFAWQTLFGGDRSAVGEKVRLNGIVVTIVGILPRDFYLSRGTVPDFSMPAAYASSVSRGALMRPGLWWVRVMARKKHDATIQQVETSLQGLFQGSALEAVSSPSVSPEQIPRLEALAASRGFVDVIHGGQQEDLLVLVWSVFTVLLLIVCLNLANLLTARAVSREYEIGMRLALGASRLRLIRQLVTESVVLATLGGVAGILLAMWGKELLRAYFGPQMPLDISGRVLAFNIVATFTTGLLFGVVPALRATRLSLNNAMKGNVRTSAQPRAMLNKSLVVIQVAMAVVLLIGAGLLVESAGNWERYDMGFNPAEFVIFDAPPDDNTQAGFYDRLARRIREERGVRAVSTAGCFPPSSCSSGLSTMDAGNPRYADARRLAVPPEFFETIGLSLVAGRNFNTADLTGDSSVAIVDEALARALYPESHPVGKRFGFGSGTLRYDFEIIGVVESAVFDVDRSRIRPNYYTPEALMGQNSGTSFVVRIAGDPQVVIPKVRQAIREVDSDFPIFGLTTLQHLVEQTRSRQRQMSATWMLFGATALLLTAIGLYGLVSYTVTRRVNEIGIRIALGASTDNVLLLVMRQFLKLVTAGLAAGFVLSLVLTQVLRSYVFGVSFVEIGTLATVGAIVVGVTAVASYLPARRGTQIDPVIALRSD
jgi:predicted permease